MASVTCRVQYLEDSDPFICTNFPEPRRPPTVSLEEDQPLSEQISGIHKLLGAPLKLEDCALQVSPSGTYLDLDSSLAEQRDELDAFYQDLAKGRKPILVLRTQLSVRVHLILERLYNSKGPELRRCLFSLKQLFQDDKDLVPEFVASEGLACFIKVGAEADHNYQNYILRALSQIMLFVDGMNGVIHHPETLQWLYTLTGSVSRLLVKTALKLLIVFVEYAESNGPLLISAVTTVDQIQGVKPWTNLLDVLEEKNGADTELLVFTMTLINKILAALPDQDSFYDVTDCLERLGMEAVVRKHLSSKGAEPDLKAQFSIYEAALRHEDGDVDDSAPLLRKERRKMAAGDQEGRRSRRSSQNLPDLLSPTPSTPVLSPSSTISSPTLDSTASSPLSSEPGSSASSPSMSPRGSPLPPQAGPGSDASTELGTKTPSSPLETGDSGSPASSPKPAPSLRSLPLAAGFNLETAEKQNQTAAADLAVTKYRTQTRLHVLGSVSVCVSCSSSPSNLSPPDPSQQNSDQLVRAESKPRQNDQRHLGANGFNDNSSCKDVEPSFRRNVSDLRKLAPPPASVQPITGLPAATRRFQVQYLYSPEDFDVNLNKPVLKKFHYQFNSFLVSWKSDQSFLVRWKSDQLPNRISWTQQNLMTDNEMLTGLTVELTNRTGSGTSGSSLTAPIRGMVVGLVSSGTGPVLVLEIRNWKITDPSATNWDKKRRNKHLSVPQLSLCDDVINPCPEPSASSTPERPGCIPTPLPQCPRARLMLRLAPLTGGVPLAPPPPSGGPSGLAKKKTVKLFWKELKQAESQQKCRFGRGTVWASLDKVEVDTARLETLFESKSKELPVAKKGPEPKKSLVLDPKRSNAINIGLTVLPAVHVIKNAILSFDEYAISKEGVEKILTMIPTEEEKQKIQEAQLANPDLPLGTAEQFLLTLASISALNPRLQLWAFKLNYEVLEKEIAEPLFDLKLGMEQLASNQTFRRILATLLAIGNFLNSSNAKGFELSYLEKVVEVKDTVHRHSLLHHTCSLLEDNYPQSSDVYSEIPAITRSAKVDFDLLAENLVQLERRCKASWENLKLVAKHESKAVLKNKMTEFLRDCTQRIKILKVVHRRVINRFHSFLLFLGQPSFSVRDVKVTSFCRIISEFALEYRTTRERVLTIRRKRTIKRERNKTRGMLITETEKFSGVPVQDSISPVSMATDPGSDQEEEHETMTSLLTSSCSSLTIHPAGPRRSRAVRSNRSASPSTLTAARDDGTNSQDDATDDIMDRLVKSVTRNPSNRTASPKTRKRSRLNRKSMRRTLKGGLDQEAVQALGLQPSKTGDR
uniref:Formin homology 2 domain containing 1 n=1 Tax=Poecilia formosa TaxID=48698 RepID=A0A087X3P8_POEFO